MRILPIVSMAVVILAGDAAPLHAQNSTAAPLSSAKERANGDESGAIRALEDASEGKTGHEKVEVPTLGTAGPARTGGAPPGTTTGR